MKIALDKYFHAYIHVFYYVAIGVFFPFLGFWFAENDLSNQQIGILFSIGPLIALLVQPLWGLLSDRFGIGKIFLMATVLLTPLFALGYRFAGEHYVYYVLTAALFALTFYAIGPISETMTVNHAIKYGQSYGGIRVLGSISFALAVTPAGFLYKYVGIQHMFSLYLTAMLLVFITLFFIGATGVKTGDKKSMLQDVGRLLSQRHLLYLFLIILLIGVGSHSYNVFFSVYVSQFGGEVSEKIGILNTAAALTELPFFIFSRRLFEKYGYLPILAFCAFAAAGRWLVLAVEPAFWLLIVSQMLHGITFALFFAAGVNFVYEASPEGMKTTGQTLFALVYINVSILIVSNAGGWLIDQHGFPVLFSIVAFLSLLGAFGFIWLHRTLSVAKKQMEIDNHHSQQNEIS